MKRMILLMLLACGSYGVYAQGQQPAPTNERESRQEQRRRQREEKTREFCLFMDSLIGGHNYVFIPNSFQIQPAGRNNAIRNVNFRMEVTDDYIDIYLPFPSTFMPPYRIGTINYTLTYVPDYTAKRSEDGSEWVMTFKSNLYGGTTYTFTLTVTTCTGSATLEISTSKLQTVTYTGYLSQIY